MKLKELTAKGWVLTENSEDVLNQYRTQKAEKAQARKEKGSIRKSRKNRIKRWYFSSTSALP